MKHLRKFALAATALLGLATAASAQEAYTTNDLGLHADPDGRMQCAPDDPTCGAATTHRRNRHDYRMDDQQQQQPQ